MDLTQLKAKSKASKKAFKKLYKRLDKQKDAVVDNMFHEAHESVFACTDCLQCANCCRTTGPLFTNRDIARISRHLQMKEADFVETYLRVDEEEDHVLQKVPCHFLDLNTNMCSIYEVRPKACAEYPHTDMRGQKKIQRLTIKNSEICPAVYEILNSIQDRC